MREFPSRDSEKPLNYGKIEKQSYLTNPRVLDADEIERFGRDVTETSDGSALREGGMPRPGIHLVALFRIDKTVSAVDITAPDARAEFFQDAKEDEAVGRLNDFANYRVFELNEEEFNKCAVKKTVQ